MGMNLRFRALVGLACLVGAPLAWGLITPHFTPVHLVGQSEEILVLCAGSNPPPGRLIYRVAEVLKGKSDKTSVEVDLTTTGFKDHADKAAGAEDKLALMFMASWSENPGAADPADGQRKKAYLHIDDAWYVLEQDKGVWKFDKESRELLATWNGGSDMLLRAAKCILNDPDGAVVPVKTGTCWSHAIKGGQVKGKVIAVAPVDLKQNGVPLIFVASDAGDRLLECTDKALTDVTAQRKLASKSLAFAWCDLAGNGRLDLASWDGQRLTIHTQGTDGTFTASVGARELAECLALAPLDIGTPPRPGLLVSTTGVPLLLIPGPDAVGKKVAEGAALGSDLGRAGACLMADFNGDSLPDIIQPFTKGSLFYKGMGGGVFQAPVACAVALGSDPASACIGDWNNDGLLDVYCTASDTGRLWENQGNGRFVDRMKLTGELPYTGGESSAIAAMACDINNDGWQDLVLLHDNGYPQIYFSRGFRAFGLSVSMDLQRVPLLPEAESGVTAGCVADFTGAGAQDLAMVMKDGQCVVLMRMPTEADLCARVLVPASAGYAGPVRVTATAGKRPLGSWNVTAGGTPAFIARPDAGPLTIKWRFPSQTEQSKTIVLESKPVTVMLNPAASR